VQPGSGDLCFITKHPIDDVLSLWKSASIEVSTARITTHIPKQSAKALSWVQVLEGSEVVERTGAVGKLRSVYCRDPDGNLIEVSNYV
jgi:catechol 2,3-dioxygenase-like lactoylglutathione lyase family enzyme